MLVERQAEAGPASRSCGCAVTCTRPARHRHHQPPRGPGAPLSQRHSTRTESLGGVTQRDQGDPVATPHPESPAPAGPRHRALLNTAEPAPGGPPEPLVLGTRAGRRGYSYSKEMRAQSTESACASSSCRWLCRDTCRCSAPTSVTYFTLENSTPGLAAPPAGLAAPPAGLGQSPPPLPLLRVPTGP